jgi:hypothetical protein
MVLSNLKGFLIIKCVSSIFLFESIVYSVFVVIIFVDLLRYLTLLLILSLSHYVALLLSLSLSLG